MLALVVLALLPLSRSKNEPVLGPSWVWPVFLPAQYVRAWCSGVRSAGTNILARCSESELPRLVGMKTRRKAVAGLKTHFLLDIL